ncbi:hypothetical protein CAEBREN_16044 [Caenorhabditis brenneri]|uniref:Domain of unknown function WSN domain-containing protein n=1 Tax=Caenorhabditis brenneri TaxID=135651 RepID=G0P001_CAEBE|nr:hypothetical protein CAEBREN_16044 [Caenorhabditis brenneri]
MWFPVLSLLLITTPSLQGNNDMTLPIKELHYKISKVVSKIVEESKVLPDPSELELAEKIEKVLEEYTEIDISSGLPELIELLELKEKADDLKTRHDPANRQYGNSTIPTANDSDLVTSLMIIDAG